MRQLIKRISTVMLIIGPLLVCGFVFFFSQSVVAYIAAAFYLTVLTAIICIYVVKDYNSVLLKLGYLPVYHLITPPHTIAHTLSIGSNAHCTTPYFQDKIIAFIGDSVTYGCDDDSDGSQLKQPWPKELASLLGCNVINYGVPSASVLDIDSWTPIAWGAYNIRES